MLVRHEVDRPAWADSASSESGSLELLLTLYALVGATICGAQTGAATQLERAARCNRRFHGGMLTPCGRAAVKVAVSCAAGRAQRRCPRVPRFYGPHPVRLTFTHTRHACQLHAHSFFTSVFTFLSTF